MEEESISGPVLVFLVGLGVAGLGFILRLNGSESGWVRAGDGILDLGGAIVVLSLLVQFFVIGSTLRRIERLLDRPESGDGKSA